MALKGVDVSAWQSNTFPVSGYNFAFIKATEGRSYTSPRHLAQVNWARKNGLFVGHYHFARPGSSVDSQVSRFLSVANPQPHDMLALDWEDSGFYGSEKDQFLKSLKKKAPGHKIILYCNVDFWLHHDTTSYFADALWIADYSAPVGKPRIQAKWTFHQYSRSDGLDKNTSVFSSKAAMSKWLGISIALLKPSYEPFPGAAFFHDGQNSSIVTRMGQRLVAEGCSKYKVGPGPQWGPADKASYAAWQHKLGYSGADADGIPGRTSWDKLKVPKG